ncbi:TonB-dependent receptor [Terracidiphilus gabretensis]|uniref:TonB-dependent receptor n=1 Tax=Terracidiphilus gabretensis TaxID=1577687 RepID=UPI001E322409|nr:TonB-dependent receptor [Terracidiphilus gabretensis]
MMLHLRGLNRRILLTLALFLPVTVFGQSGNAGAVRGTVTDSSGAVIPGAVIHLTDTISGFNKTATSDPTGQFVFANVPFNGYKVTVSAKGFASLSQPAELRSSVGLTLKLVLQISGNIDTVTVEASSGDLTENDPTFHTDVDRDLFIKVPMESQSSSLSSLVTSTTPGVAADSNGLFHGLGDHASNSFSIDGQSITDQQSKVFSNQIPSDSIQSIEVISGAPPAEFGGKTSLVIVATTRSGQGITKPTGSISSTYGSFGSVTGGFDLSYGGKNWGNFLEADGMNSGRFLDPPEFSVFHDKGNEQNVFDRIDYMLTPVDSMHLDLNYSRSWFQTPNTYDNLNVQNIVSDGTSASPVFGNAGDADQRSQIRTFNISPTYTRVLNDHTVWNFGAFMRKDLYHYYPSDDALADLGPANLQTSSIFQNRTLTNAAVHSDFTWTRGIHNVKLGAQYGQTFLRESDALGIVDSTYSLSAPCVDANGNPLPGYTADSCPQGQQNPNYLPVLTPYDLTRGGASYFYFGHTDVKELALYAQDQIKIGNWTANVGIRGDLYNGLTVARQAEPRAGVAYKIKPSNTVLGVSYARTLETPFNENLVLSSEGCANPVLSPLLACSPGASGTLQPGFRNEFHASIQQAFSTWAVVSGEYIWKYTHNAFDFSVLGNTPITFPIDWHNSKIPGYALRAEMPEHRHISAYFVASSVAARFFPPQSAGAGATVGQGGAPFRIDHDEKFNQTTHLQYQIGKRGPWAGFNWRYDSGLVAGSAPCYNANPNANTDCSPFSVDANGNPNLLNGQPFINLGGLTADQQFEAGLSCNGAKATIGNPIMTDGQPGCIATQLTSSLISIPKPGTEDADLSPTRIAPRNLFDATVGQDNIFRTDHYKVNLNLTAINFTDKYALYNFLSTFSGTHYVTPRALTAKITLNF